MEEKLKTWVAEFGTREFVPKLFTLLKEGIPRAQVRRDVLSGITVGVVALPLAIAFAIASGVSPEKGLITAIFAGFIISAFGGSRVQIGGPTGAFIVIVFGIVQDHGIEGLTFATFIAGFMLIGMGLLRFGSLLRYVPQPLIVGFTSGIALIIFSSQIRDFLGLGMATVPAHFVEKWMAYAQNLGTINLAALGIGLSSILITLYFSKITTRVPGPLAALLLCTLAAAVFKLPVETIGSRFGEIPRTLPAPKFYLLDYQTIKSLISPAFAIALLGGIESLLSAVVADGMIGGRHRSNMELIAQGGANIVSAVFGGIPATGAIARTATNVKNGGRTPVAGIVHAAILLIIMLLAAPLAKLVPMACLAGILIVVAYNMSEWRVFVSIFRGNIYDRLVLVTVFLLTVIFDLIVAIEIGMILSAFLFMKRMADITQVNVLGDASRERMFESEYGVLPRGIVMYEVNGPLFFGASQSFQNILQETNQNPRCVIFNLRHSGFIDQTGLYRLKEVVRGFSNSKTQVLITGFNDLIAGELEQSDIVNHAKLIPEVQECVQLARQFVVEIKP